MKMGVKILILLIRTHVQEKIRFASSLLVPASNTVDESVYPKEFLDFTLFIHWVLGCIVTVNLADCFCEVIFWVVSAFLSSDLYHACEGQKGSEVKFSLHWRRP